MQINQYNQKFFKKTDLKFNSLIECLEFLVKELKHDKCTNATIELIEKKITETKIELTVIDPMLAKLYNPEVLITLNGHQKMNSVEI